MTAVGITENVKGDVKKFEIWYSGREEVYVVQVRSLQKFKYSSSLTVKPFAVMISWSFNESIIELIENNFDNQFICFFKQKCQIFPVP